MDDTADKGTVEESSADLTWKVDEEATEALEVLEAEEAASFEITDQGAGETQPLDARAHAGDGDGAQAELERPLHRAYCQHAKCRVSVEYRLTPSGHGFAILAREGCDDEATTFSMGAHGRPSCPYGHGELTGADDLLPAEEAIAEAARRLEAQRLPFPALPFDWASAGRTIVEKRHEVKQLERDFEAADARRKKAKAALDEAFAELGKIIDRYDEAEQDRRLEAERQERQAAEGHPGGANLVRCRFEQLHPGQACPLCAGDGPIDPEWRDSETHVIQARAKLEELACAGLAEALEAICHVVIPWQVLRGYSLEARQRVSEWIDGVKAAEGNGAPPARPELLGTAHIAGEVAEGAEVQCCRECGATLLDLEFGAVEPYKAGTFVGVDCASVQDVAHHYPRPRGEAKKGRARRSAPALPGRKAGKADKPARRRGR